MSDPSVGEMHAMQALEFLLYRDSIACVSTFQASLSLRQGRKLEIRTP